MSNDIDQARELELAKHEITFLMGQLEVRSEVADALRALVDFIESEHDLHAVFVTKDSAAFAYAKAALNNSNK